MDVQISEESSASLESYALVSIAFEVEEVLDITSDDHLGGFELSERRIEAPYVKDYDALDGGPARWSERFDTSTFGLFGASVDGQRVGGAAVAFDTAGLSLLEERTDLALLWDIRISPDHRGQGIGSALLRAVEQWAVARGCRQLKVETQNINVPACGFYSRRGFVLGQVQRFAYPELPDEVQLLWYKALVG